MITGLLIGKHNSSGVPGKNYRHILGKPMCEYGFIAAKKANVDNLFVSTDSPIIAEVGGRYDAQLINRPPDLALKDSLTEDALVHAATSIEKTLGEAPDIVVLLFANNPAINYKLIRKGINLLEKDQSLDSAFSVCRYDMFSPLRARKIDENGLIQSFDESLIDDSASSIRDSQGGVYFCDLSVQVMRWRCFENMNDGMQPFKWMGKKSIALHNDYGFDVDTEWQFKVIEHWLLEHAD